MSRLEPLNMYFPFRSPHTIEKKVQKSTETYNPQMEKNGNNSIKLNMRYEYVHCLCFGGGF